MKKMDAERWRKIERIYNRVLELEPVERETFLNKACEEDASIRKDVLRLLENQKEAGSFMESPAVDLLAGIKTNKESFLPGKQISSYKIISKIGRGGMGEVYQARDLKLGREVAVKILPEEFAGDRERVARFQREAKLLASLNHTNIAAIYGLEEAAGMQFLVLELVEGETLSDKIARGPVRVEEALKLSLQLAEGLEAAHERGIIHRDLKPANVMIAGEEKVKILDFGLAKALAEETPSIDSSKPPTLTEEMTRPDVIMGTAAYMSPEQAKGKTADKRTDIWAFGCVLYEMLTGQAVFQGESVTEILASVLKADIDLEPLPENINPKVKQILGRCLQKDPRERYRDIGDVLYDMKQILSDPTGAWGPSKIGAEQGKKIAVLLPWFIAFSGMLIIGIGVWLLKPMPPAASSKVVFQHELLPGQEFSNLEYPALAVSPDDRQIVYGTSTGLYLRSIDSLDSRLIVQGEENPRQPFFSPDGEWIGYFSEKEQLLKKVRADGGIPVELCPVKLLLGASWNADNTILFGQYPYGIMQIPANGGDAELLFKKENIPLAQPQLLPDTKSLLLTIEVDGERRIAVLHPESGDLKELFSGTDARYIPSGYLLYMRENKILADQFNPDTLETKGTPIVLRDDVLSPQFSISNAGTLAYVPETVSNPGSKRTLVWVDRGGKVEEIPLPADNYMYPTISPDGTQLAYAINYGERSNILIWDLQREFEWFFTSGDTSDTIPVWISEGTKIAFGSNRLGDFSAFWKSVNGNGGAELLGAIPDRWIFPYSFSPDNKTLLLLVLDMDTAQLDIGVLSIGEDREPRLLLEEKYAEAQPKVSPRGRFIAYAAEISGQPQVYVDTFPDMSKDPWQVSIDGGNSPLWSPNGDELFYRKDNAFIAVAVETVPTFKHGKPEILFKGDYFGLENDINEAHPWDIHPDGKRFLMMRPADTSSNELKAGSSNKVDIVLNCFEELKEKAPVD